MNNQTNYTMLCDFYELSMANGYFQTPLKDCITYFDVFFRTIPDEGGFAITAGLEQVVNYIQNLTFTDEDIEYLRSKGGFVEEFLDYLKNFKFTGDIWAIPEGTTVFPREPILTVRAPAIQAQFIETYILLVLNHQSLIATKSNRIVRAGDTFYLLTDTGVECLSTDGTSQWTQSLSARPQGLLADRRQLLVFCGNTVQVLTPPAAENNAQSNT